MDSLPILIILALGVAGALAIFYTTRKSSADTKLQESEAKIKASWSESEKTVQNMLGKAQREAQDIIQKSKSSLDDEIRQRRREIDQIESRLMQKEQHLDTRESHLQEKETGLASDVEKNRHLKKGYEEQLKELIVMLEKVAQLSVEEARNYLLTNVEKDIRQRAGLMIKQVEEQAKKIANRKAKEIVTDAIQRTAMDYVVPATTSLVHLPDDDMKGRIIGREGRNIRAFEAITGVDVIIDDTPGAVILSCFNPIRREIAKIALQKLIVDGRIHPTRVEEVVEKSKKELDEIIRERGEKAAEELGLQFHPKIIELLGKLYYRTSYGQNILGHVVETAKLAAVMAAELQVNVNLAKRGGVLHDIGKALDFEQEGTHSHIGEEICKKYGESNEVINCIMAHHEDEDPETIEAVLVTIADAISSARPGARRESLETYVKRLEKLEVIANSFEGVEKAFAIQAGREIRVIVKPDTVDDPGTYKLAMDMAKRIEQDMEYPGEVKVSVIRETRAVGIAR